MKVTSSCGIYKTICYNELLIVIWTENCKVLKFHVNNSINCSTFIAVRLIHRNNNYWSQIKL